jgi:hypothetical protein
MPKIVIKMTSNGKSIAVIIMKMRNFPAKSRIKRSIDHIIQTS